MNAPQLVDNWRVIVRRSASFWFGALSAIAGAVEVAQQVAPGLLPLLPENVAGRIAVVLAAAVPAARVIKQNLERE